MSRKVITLEQVYPIKYFEGHYTCELTKRIDEFLIGLTDSYYTYLYEFKSDNNQDHTHIYLIRSPGSTKGCVYTNKKGVITEIKIYNNALYYFRPGIKEVENEFLGYKIITKGEKTNESNKDKKRFKNNMD